jgi:DNA-binding ferritin-like protein (Dps family)
MKVISEITNSENETIKIAKIETGKFKDQSLLVFVGDDNFTTAIHLLDKQTKDWLRNYLNSLEENNEKIH